MKVNKLKFSHKYQKMFYSVIESEFIPKIATLIEVFVVDSKDLHPRFVEYDTIYWDEEKNNWAYYKLPKGKVLVLLLKTNNMIWTTIRRFTPKKYEYYKKKRWEDFVIVIK